MRVNIDEIAMVLGSPSPTGDVVITGISTDTRTLVPGDLFFALANEKADGHDFLEQAVEKGAAAAVVSRLVTGLSIPVMRVQDTTYAYGRLARSWRDSFDIPVVGVTGSVGKTTVKEMLALALSPLGPVLRTELSQNNETGVPKTLLQLNKTHRAAVIEMGMRGKGQIADLCRIAAPSIGIVTIISDNHAELLGSRDAIADAKGELLESLSTGGIAVLNADDPYLERLRNKTSGRVITYGFSDEAHYRVTELKSGESAWTFQLRLAQTDISLSVMVPSPSRHDVSNALAALAAANLSGARLEDSIRALADYAGAPMRMQVSQADWGGTILNDAYNAAPASMRSALETLAGYSGRRKIAFLGDMRELGALAEPSHRELGDVIAGLGGVDALFTVGDLAGLIPGSSGRFADSAAAAEFASTMDLADGDVILVKGSRAMAMEKIAQALLARKRDSC